MLGSRWGLCPRSLSRAPRAWRGEAATGSGPGVRAPAWLSGTGAPAAPTMATATGVSQRAGRALVSALVGMLDLPERTQRPCALRGHRQRTHNSQAPAGPIFGGRTQLRMNLHGCRFVHETLHTGQSGGQGSAHKPLTRTGGPGCPHPASQPAGLGNRPQGRFTELRGS